MSQHYVRRMIGTTVSAWCNVCQDWTSHRIDPVTPEKKAGRLGPCLRTHVRVNRRGENKKQQTAREKRERESGELFNG